jgi:two-component system, NtrC family, response regulator HydG
MKTSDLDFRELLDFNPAGGPLFFAGARTILLDTVAFGLLRRQLIDGFGLAAARVLLTQMGFAHGWRTAEVLRDAFPWDSNDEWRLAGAKLHRLAGMVRHEFDSYGGPGPEPFAHSVWRDSYEAEQHLLQVGASKVPVCWTLAGFASGYMSFCNGERIYCLEEACTGCGDPACRVVGRRREEWSEAMQEEIDALYAPDALDRALERMARELRERGDEATIRQESLTTIAHGEDVPAGMVVHSDAMRKVLLLARRVSAVDTTVLITGESGVGKERLAQYIHSRSSRGSQAFVAVNCGAVEESLLESELFGHRKGAFTGADRDRKGLFEAAEGGTIFLDEIGEVSPAMQVKLLRVLQEREVRPVGSSRTIPVDIRILAATNRDLRREMEAGRFREDLYYRLNVFGLEVPPLRERREDILELARIFLSSASSRMERPIVGLSPGAADALLLHPWPGNVRELHNAMEYAAVVCTSPRVQLEDLPSSVRDALGAVGTTKARRSLEEVEREHILRIMNECDGNREEAAAILGIGVATLYRRLKHYRDRGLLG